MQYRAEIDGLRALAVLPVILFHAGFEFFGGGFVGVDVFFVISGYLITSLIINDINKDTFSIVNFYKRRARRILPALLFVMFVCLPFAWLILIPSELKDFGQSLVAISIFSSNILFWIESGYFDAAAELKPLLHTWSLAVEEQFYILFPVFLTITWHLGIKKISFFLLIVFVGSLGLAEWSSNQIDNQKLVSAAYFMIPTRAWELLAGVFIALYLKNYNFFKSKTLNEILSLIGFSMITYSVIVFDKNTPFPSFYTLIPVVGSSLIILCSVQKTVIYNFLTLKPIVGLGLISYSAYLWHQPLLAFARNSVLDQISEIIILGICFASLIFAWISYRFIETPFRNNRLTSSRFTAKILLSSTLIFTILGLTLHFNNGFENRLNYGENINTIRKSPMRDTCHTVDIPCKFFEGAPKFATFGDSHVVELSYALAEYLRSYNVGVQQNSYTSCSPNLSNKESYCHDWTTKSIDRIINDIEIEVVIVSFSLVKTGLDRQKIVSKDLEAIVKLFAKNDKKVYLLIQPPFLDYSIQKQILVKNSQDIIGPTRLQWKNQNNFVYSILKRLPEDIVVLDAADVFCDDIRCYGNDDNGYYYYDDNHISLYGARKIVEYFSSYFFDDAM